MSNKKIALLMASAALVSTAIVAWCTYNYTMKSMKVDMVSHNIVRCDVGGQWWNYEVVPKQNKISITMDRIEGDYAVMEILDENGVISYMDVKVNK